MNRILFEASEIEHNTLCLKQGDPRLKHIKSVLKLHEGDSFKAGIINSALCTAHITAHSPQELRATLSDLKEAPTLPPLHVILAIPRPIQLKRIFRSLGELGVSSISLLGSDLGEKSYRDSSLLSEENIYRFLCDATAQAGQARLPHVHMYHSVDSFFKHCTTLSSASPDAKIIFDLVPDAKHVQDISLSQEQQLWLAIGSERGWTERERKLFKQQAFSATTLGNRILRTETALTVAVGILLSKIHQ